MSRKEVNNEQAQWDREKKHKDALIRRKKMNEAMHWLFTDEATAHGGLGEYEMRKKGLVPTANFRVLMTDRTWELPGLGGGGEGWGASQALHAIVSEPWDSFEQLCPVVSSRQIITAGKHMFKIIIKERQNPEFLASDGLIKVGFYHAGLDPKMAWNTSEMDGHVWYYRNFGNLWCGSKSAPETSAPGFAPGDVVTAILNVNAGTAQFCKRTRVRGRTPEDDKEFETQLVTIHGVECTEAGLRFGVQMDRDGPGIVMLDYEVITAEDASERAEGWKKLGVRHIEKGEWDEATNCFKKAATFFGDAMDKENRKLMNSMAAESAFLKQTDGLGSPGQSIFRTHGIQAGRHSPLSRSSPLAAKSPLGSPARQQQRPLPAKPSFLK